MVAKILSFLLKNQILENVAYICRLVGFSKLSPRIRFLDSPATLTAIRH